MRQIKMKPLVFLLITIFSAFAVTFALGQEPASSPSSRKAAFREDRVLVKLKPDKSPLSLRALQEELGTKTVRRFPLMPQLQVDVITRGQSVEEVIQEYQKNPAVEYAEPDYVVHALQTPNDSKFNKLWGLHNAGGSGCTDHADIHALEAWKTRREASAVIVAVIDSGVRYTHEDLKDNMWRNPGESGAGKENNGRDDDADGLIDDVYGMDATVHYVAPGTPQEKTRAGDPMDENGHGTHCAGTIGAVGNNRKGVVGVAWKVQIMACKCIDRTGNGSIEDAIACIDYTRAKGAQITSNSWGTEAFSQSLRDAIEAANSQGIIFVAAVGNDAHDNDKNPTYPASYTLPNVVAVANSTCKDELRSSSNFGKKTVHLAAPGSDILSTWFLNDSSYETTSGTSMAAPYVAGALALMKAQFPNLTHTDLIAKLLKTVDKPPSLAGKVISDGRLNLQAALQ
jgi:subtilisin family serine protease